MTTNDSRENTYIFDPESIAEMGRLIDQDRMVTTAMGGPLAGIEESSFQNVLDIACGPGGWVLDIAFEHPNAEICGVDISHGMIEYANARASSQGINNASFGVMDITQPLDFADASFDLVNARFIFSVLKRENWSGFLAECTRILRPGGTLRLTEPIDPGETTSPAFNQLASLLLQAMHHAGYGFSTNGRTFGMAPTLAHLLHEMDYQQIRHFASIQNYSEYMPTWGDFLRNNEIAYQQTLPLLVKMGLISQEEGERLYAQMRIELRSPDFAAMAYTTTLLGVHPV